jgi:hypothetical protein
MNLLGHTYVALAGGRDDPEYLLGAVLPDLAPMAGVRLRARSDLPGAVGEGVRCHLRSDRAFHAHARFRAGAAALRRAVAAAGVASGPSRAVGHAGWELLLDGTLVGTEVEWAFHGAVGAAGEQVADALAPGDRARWAAFLARARRGGRLRYDEPRWVADRLHAMLARRPRLRLPDHHVATVADALAAHADGVIAAAPAVLGDTLLAAEAPTAPGDTPLAPESPRRPPAGPGPGLA